MGESFLGLLLDARRARKRSVAALAPLLLFAHHPALAENLEQAWEAAIAADQRLNAARLQKDAARSVLSAAEGARLLRLSLESAYTALDQQPAARIRNPLLPLDQFPLAEKDSLSYRATLSVPLYAGGRITRGIEAAEAEFEAAEQDDLRSRIALEVRQVWLDKQKTESRIAVARNMAQIGLLIVAPILLLSGVWTPPDAMPAWLRAGTLVSPLRHYIGAAYGILLKGAGVELLWDSILALGLVGGAIFAFGVWRLRRQFG